MIQQKSFSLNIKHKNNDYSNRIKILKNEKVILDWNLKEKNI